METGIVNTHGFWSVDDVRVAELAALTATTTSLDHYRHAVAIEQQVVVYDMAALRGTIESEEGRRSVMTEIADVLQNGPGVVAMKGAVPAPILDEASSAFDTIIEAERNAAIGVGDHFAESGTNDRVWNALEKLAISAPGVFVDYYANAATALAATAWLGPAYQVTSQLNVVNPGGTAQSPHRDYHLGFMTDEQAALYPAHVHGLSAALTLQGAIAHVDMPIESGPTKLLPHSQKYPPGYLAWRQPEVIDHFEAHHIQLPLAAGDAVFFNPALFHAAGTNHTVDVHRMANLLQISSAFGRAMESIDRARIVRAIYPELLERLDAGWHEEPLEAAIASAAEGYAFPTNLDSDPPTDALAPASQADIVRAALREHWPPSRLEAALSAQDQRRRTN